ncbi:MAG: DAK2 domain-containing protein, partial [Paracoccaceae bacterium]|nr:DAK2 domain-containing protein [Paracoccaceae bacterium]
DKGFAAALAEMAEAAEKGRDSTIDLVARIGRSSRLGERSRGVLDAGATSCCLILTSLGASIRKRLS